MTTPSITIAAFREIPGARALRYSYDWHSGGRVAWWVEEDADEGWVLVGLYPDETLPCSHFAGFYGSHRDVAVRHLNRHIGPRRILAREPNLTIDEWEIAP